MIATRILLGLLATIAAVIAHPACILMIDSPYASDHVIAGCPAYTEDVPTCCPSAEEEAAARLTIGSTSPACEAAAQAIGCAACDAWSGHLFEHQDVPHIVGDLCSNVVEACAGNTVVFSGGHLGSTELVLNLTAITSDDDKEAFCEGKETHTFTYDGSPYEPNEPEVSETSDFCLIPENTAAESRVYLGLVDIPGSSWGVLAHGFNTIHLIPRDPVTHAILWEEEEEVVFLPHALVGTDESIVSAVFHPEDATRVFVNYPCDPEVCVPSCTSNADCDNGFSTCEAGVCTNLRSVLRFEEWHLPSVPLGAGEEMTMTKVIMEIHEPHQWHNGGPIMMVPSLGGDDYEMMVALGDGGKWLDFWERSQNTTSRLGKVLRVTLDGEPSPSNPWLDEPDVLPEIWALGLRNPWRCSLDRAFSDVILCGDVGQELTEEVNQINRGRNYGWPKWEGFNTTGIVDELSPLGVYTPPLAVIAHDQGVPAAIIGGFVMRPGADDELAGLAGQYLYADYRSGLFLLESSDGGGTWASTTELPMWPCWGCENENEYSLVPGEQDTILSFAELNRNPGSPEDGAEYYVLTYGQVYKLEGLSNCRASPPAPPPPPPPPPPPSPLPTPARATSGDATMTAVPVLAMAALGGVAAFVVLFAKRPDLFPCRVRGQ